MSRADLSVVVVTWNSAGDIERCLRSIDRERGALRTEVIIVDNGSADGTADVARQALPGVQLIELGANVGYPRANNVGFARAQGRYVLALNPDTELGPGSLDGPVAFLDEHPDYGAVGVKTCLPDGRIQLHCARQFPSLTGMLATYFYLDKLFRRARFLGSPDMPFWDHRDSRDIDMIQGAYMLLRKAMIDEIGGFNDELPMFFEDRELCLRVWRSGRRIRYMAEHSMVHVAGQSTRQADPAWIGRLRLESDYMFVRAYQGSGRASLFALAVLLGFPVKLVLSAVLGCVLSVARRRPILREWVTLSLVSVPWAARRLLGRARAGGARREAVGGRPSPPGGR